MPLSGGILRCGHCGAPLHGVQQGKQPVVYRCSAAPNRRSPDRKFPCGRAAVREDRILPFLMKLLGEEIANIQALLTAPPDHLREADKRRTARRSELLSQRKDLAVQVDRAESNLLMAESETIFKSLAPRVEALKDELGRLDVELAAEDPEPAGYTRDEVRALAEWWRQFNADAVSLPVKNIDVVTSFHADLESDDPAVLVDPRKINEALHEVGAQCKLWWRTEKGAKRDRHLLVKGEFKLGQREGKLPQYLLGTSACPSTCSCWSDRSRGR